MKPSTIYRPSLALLTDFYELTMAQAYFASGMAETPAVFNLFFRKAPFGGGYTVACGLAAVTDFIEHFGFDAQDLAFLSAQVDDRGAPLFTSAFLEYLGDLKLTLDVDAIPEGTVVFPQEPLVRVRGPLAQAQLVETALLTLINYSSLVATKAAGVVLAAGGAPVLEFGLRRAQGIDGGLTASYAAHVGGCAATSNTLSGRLFGIPVRGTHAHSWVLSFASEQEAFDAYAEAMPANSTLLVDTYDTAGGVRAAIETGRVLRERGFDLAGIRLDSGDLAYLSIEAREMLDAAGFTATRIVASNDLDAATIASLRAQGARIDTYGVGTKLVTCYDQPALGGVYKLVAIADGPGGSWRTPIKISEDPIKVTIPGILAVRRFYDETGTARADMIYDEELGVIARDGRAEIVDPASELRRRYIEEGWSSRELLISVFRAGVRVHDPATISEARAHAGAQLASFPDAIKRALNPHRYPAGLELGLHNRRRTLIEERLETKLAAERTARETG
jgi:nicotinate phosphoribosyltransferase